jgi:ATP-dependent Clp protease ATP-binding subunit ClpX
VARLDDLSKDALVRILTEPKNSIYHQFRNILGSDGVVLDIERIVFEQIAELALEYKAGARSLRGIFEGMMTDVLYTIADDKRIRRVAIGSLFDLPRYER